MSSLRSPENYWSAVLARVPSLFELLSLLSEYRDPLTGLYRHDGMAQLFGSDTANRVIRQSHEDTFYRWLRSPLRAQRADLGLFLNLRADRDALLRYWRRSQAYERFVPDCASPNERTLFALDVSVLLRVFKDDRANAAFGPTGLLLPQPDR